MFRTQNLYPGSKNIFELRQFNAWIRNVKQKYGWTAISLVIFVYQADMSRDHFVNIWYIGSEFPRILLIKK